MQARSRRHVPYAGEVYAIYIVQHAKRHGLGQEMFERVQSWLAAQRLHSMIVWVLENNHHARGFYEAMGGSASMSLQCIVGGFPVTEVAYVWDRF